MAVSVVDALILAIVQGVTEWLPISSSGHLALTQRLLGIEVPVAYDLWLHVGTLLAVIVYYRRRLVELTRAVLVGPAATKKDGWKAAWLGDLDRRLALAVVLGTVPIVIAGVLLESLVKDTFNSLVWIGWTFLANAVLLALAGVRRPTHGAGDVRVKDGVAAGVMQVFALLPAISRSGATLAGGMWAGLDRPSAADLAFLLSIPALTGAVVFQAPELAGMGDVGWPAIAIGLVGTFAVGYGSIAFLLSWVRRHSLAGFAAYSAALGTGILIALAL
ncbi:MAG TPA: undecaprenyl-diphosphate phosphatase [Candidatus Thermoplasmatota archaeon]|nr:undecaprenyl-diphosphate phosphatase [Candidatus Thermoplasmatota archaeon]